MATAQQRIEAEAEQDRNEVELREWFAETWPKVPADGRRLLLEALAAGDVMSAAAILGVEVVGVEVAGAKGASQQYLDAGFKAIGSLAGVMLGALILEAES